MNGESIIKNGPFPSIVSDFGYSPLGSAVWFIDPDNGLPSRDLSLVHASEGKLVGRHYRSGGRAVDAVRFGADDAALKFILVVSGRVTLDQEGKSPVALNALDSATQYGAGKPTRFHLSHDAEVITLISGTNDPDVFGTPAIGEWGVSREAEEHYITGEGPRKFFAYRNLGVDALTGRRIHIHLVRAAKSVEGGTGWHSHSMGQLFYILRGWAHLAVSGRPALRMESGDAMCIAPRMAHDVPAFSEDYFLIEMCVPADYDTVDAPVKEAALP